MEKIKKEKRQAFGKDIYLLGEDKEGTKYWLEEATWDCGWYWGFGYIETYTNNNNPENSRDINSHQHFDELFLKGNILNGYNDFFEKSTLSDNEIWVLLGYMKEFYVSQEYAELLRYGNHITSRAKNIKEEENEEANKKECERINKTLLPELFKKIYDLLTIEPEPKGTKILQCKNKYGYVVKQLKIDYDKKTFAVGSFTIGADATVSRKLINEKIEELKILGFIEK